MQFLSRDSWNEFKMEKIKALQNKIYLLIFTLVLAIIVTIIWILSVIEFRNIRQCENQHFSIVPRQIHLSLGQNPHQMVVTWTTHNWTDQSKVWFGVESTSNVAYGQQTEFVDGGMAKRVAMYIHRVYLSDLKPNTTYKYIVGCNASRSEQYFFRTFPDPDTQNTNWSPTIAVFGDLSAQFGKIYKRLEEEVQQGLVDVIMHVGDLVDSIESNDETKEDDEFMKKIESFAAYVPYQVCPGDHEQAYNFSSYNNHYAMHSSGNDQVNNFFWSYDIGPAHIISFNTEFHFFPEYGMDLIMNQYKWLEQDLIKANQPEQRAKHPWIIAMGHRPFYSEMQDITREDDILREGNEIIPGLEDLFFKYGVDLNLFGHVDNYERMWPIFDGVVRNGSENTPYTNPKAPVHITTGSGGVQKKDNVLPKRQDYSAFVDSDAGFTRLGLLNKTHLRIQQISDPLDDIIDDFFMVKDTMFPEFDSMFDALNDLLDNELTGIRF